MSHRKVEKVAALATHSVTFTVTSLTKPRPTPQPEPVNPIPPPVPTPAFTFPYSSYLVDWVSIEIDLDHPAAADVSIYLVSPKYTRSVLASYREDVPLDTVG